jgi:stage V sporulation protein SpoVS
VLHDDGDAVGFRTGQGEELLVAELGDGVVSQALVAAQAAKDFVEIMGAEIASVPTSHNVRAASRM